MIVNEIPKHGILPTTKTYNEHHLRQEGGKEIMALWYALLHHPRYLSQFQDFLKTELPLMPVLTPEIQTQLTALGWRLIVI